LTLLLILILILILISIFFQRPKSERPASRAFREAGRHDTERRKEFVEGRGFTGCGKTQVCSRASLHSLRKRSVLYLILGGAAVYRCGKYIVLNPALAAEGTALARK
jgi:hypothetical protein